MADSTNDKLYSILAYISILVLVPILAGKDSETCRFHANQGLVLLIAEIAAQILVALSGFFYFFSLIGNLVLLACVVFSIVGIVNAARMEQKPLPIIGDIHILR